MDNERRIEVTPAQAGVILAAVAVISFFILIDAHWETIEEWVEAFFTFLIILVSVAGVILVLVMVRGLGVPNPLNRYEWYNWQMEREVNRVRGGKDDSELSEWEIELIDKIQNHYRDKIDKLYD